MAELDVQPKKSNPWWLWLLLTLIALAILFFLLRGCNNENKTVALTDSSNTQATTTTDSTGWDTIDWNAPNAAYDEVNDADVNVRGNDKYAIYSLDETVLFDSEKSTIKPTAEQKLKQISASISKRFKDAEIRIYGHTDSTGTAATNKELAEQRAESVRTWLVKNGDITEGRISLHPIGEEQPVASNATPSGRQKNRRVEIVARIK